MSHSLDPLDAFMASLEQEFEPQNANPKAAASSGSSSKRLTLSDDDDGADDDDKASKQKRASLANSEDEDQAAVRALDSDFLSRATPEDIMALAQKRMRKKGLVAVDHASIKYQPFRKDFYTETSDISKMTEDEVRLLRASLDNIRVKGSDCPKPIRKWTQCGLSPKLLDVLAKGCGYAQPTPIQCQAIPALMSGRDVIGIASTGSGKTIAYLLPMFRHIRDQRALGPSEGPIALVLTPTRELATQVALECKKLSRPFSFLRTVCAYGGSSIKDQIADLRRGAEIVVCTPGRMIDLLCANSGRVTNLKRVTYVVIDEADRMFDMGFEPQVTKIMDLVRPDRQTALFSATFPKVMDALAKRISTNALEITVGRGRSVVNSDITQVVRVVPEDKKFVNLLEILGQVDADSRTLIFVDRQDSADTLFKDLLRKGHVCISIHGGKDQADRDSSLDDFKRGDIPILIATSVAARGLDVKELNLVINYDCPNHMEDYVHRVGRTGRAGRKGTAVTLVTPDQEKYALDLVRALAASKTPIPPDLQALADRFLEKIKLGLVRYASGGFGGKGLDQIDRARDSVMNVQKQSYGEGEEDVLFLPASSAEGGGAEEKKAKAKTSSLAEIAAKINSRLGTGDEDGESKSAEINARLGGAGSSSGEVVPQPEADGRLTWRCEIDINDYPQYVRWKVTTKDVFKKIQETHSVSLVARGSYIAPNKPNMSGDRRLHLLIESSGDELSVHRAKKELIEVIVEATQEAFSKGSFDNAKYSVL